MSSRASGGALAACLIAAAVVGFAGGAYIGSRDDGGGTGGPSQTTPPGDETPVSDEDPAADGLTLTADPTTVPPNGLIAIAGTITPAEAGVELKVQRQIGDGAWEDFPSSDRPITLTSRADGTFSGSVATGQPGPNSFRVLNVEIEEMASNEVPVTVGD